VEYELVELLTTATNLPWADYANIDVEQLLYDGKLANPNFFTTMYDRPDVYSRAFRVMASIAVCSRDWRVIRILQGLHSLLFNKDDSEAKTMGNVEMRMLFPPCTKLSQLSLFAPYFPSELFALFERPSFTFDELNQRMEQCLFARREAYPDVRNQIWLILMMSGSLLRATTSQVINEDDCQEVSW
jgi:hypothetical protein